MTGERALRITPLLLVLVGYTLGAATFGAAYALGDRAFRVGYISNSLGIIGLLAWGLILAATTWGAVNLHKRRSQNFISDAGPYRLGDIVAGAGGIPIFLWTVRVVFFPSWVY